MFVAYRRVWLVQIQCIQWEVLRVCTLVDPLQYPSAWTSEYLWRELDVLTQCIVAETVN